MIPVISVQMPSAAMAPPQRRAEGWALYCWNNLRSAFGRPAAEPKLWTALLPAGFIALVVLTLPTVAPDLGADASWGAVLRWAHEHGLQFGKDIVFTYGPLGFLFAPYTLAQPTETVVLANTALCLQSALGLCLIAGRLGPAWRWLLLGIFVFESATIDSRADLVVEVGLLCWGLLCLVESDRRQGFCAASFALLAGLVSLMKLTHLLAAGLSVCGVTFYTLLDGKRWLGILVPIGFAGVFLLGWLACGQALSHLGSFLFNGFLVSRGYDQAVGLEGLSMLRLGGSLLGFLALAAILLRTLSALDPSERHPGWRRASLLAWVTAFFFIVWKHSMVRVDRYHIVELVVFAPVVTLALEALPGSGPKVGRATRALAIACCVVSWGMMQYAFLPGWTACLSQPFRQLAYHGRWLVSPADCRVQLEPALEAWRGEADLPKLRPLLGQASVDVFGLHQAHALLNGLNYRPRPVFQSYAAYSTGLAKLNEQFYLSDRAPDYVLLELSALDHRFLALNDGLALRTLLSNYQPVASEAPFLLVKRESEMPPKLTLLREGAVKPGEPILLSQYAGQELWMELEMDPSLLGRFVGLLTRPAAVRLSAWRQTSTGPRLIARRRVAPCMLSIGFVASPCLLNLQDVRNWYSGERLVRPSAYSVELSPGTERFWKPTARFRIYQIENRPN